MSRSLRTLGVSLGVLLAWVSVAGAQTPTAQAAPQPAQPAATQPSDVALAPASTTWLGDTGFWFVPTGEVVPDHRFSASGYYTNHDRTEAYSDIANFIGTAAFGLKDRVEIFGSFRFYTRIDVDRRPVAVGGLPMDYPLINSGWETGVGDLYVGAKFNLLSQWRQQPLAFAVRGIVKIPTGDDAKGLGTGEPDFLLDAILSKEINEKVEVSGHVGATFRGAPDNFDLSDGFRWGLGIGAPSRGRIKFIGELTGESYFDSTVTTSFAPGTGPEALPASYKVESPFDGFAGIDFHVTDAFFLSGGVGIPFGFKSRSDIEPDTDSGLGDRVQGVIRLGYHPGRRIYQPPAPPAPPPTPPVAANRPPTVKIRCEPCTVQVGKSSTVTADEQDPDGDTLTNKWSAPTGTFASPTARQTIWTAPDQEGAVQVTKTVDDGKGGTASDTVTIQVVRPPVRQYTFEDVHFDFDRYTLRPDATRILDEAIKAMQDNPDLRLTIEGHTCNIGTAEYNLALGERRAAAVREYLAGRGIGANRLQTISYGEERPKHDNSREETRRLNRRAALTIRLQ